MSKKETKTNKTEVPTEKINKYEEIEKELNKLAVPVDFHDDFLVNLCINNGKIHIRATLHKYKDLYGILEDDRHFALLDGIYEDIKIKDLYLYDGIDFRNVSIVTFEENPKTNEINIYLEFDYGFYFSITFTYKKYRWSVYDVITEEEYFSDLYSKTGDVLNTICDLTEKYSPEWAKFED